MNTLRTIRLLARHALLSAGVWTGLFMFAALRPAYSQESAPEPAIDPPGRVARLSLIDGDVSIAPADSEEWADAVLNRPLTGGDRLAIGSDGRAEMQAGSLTVHLDRDTDFGFIELDDDVLQASLTKGAATIHVRRLGERETIQLETPNATVFLRRVGEYSLEIDSAGDRTIVKTRSGEAEVVGGGSKTYRVRAKETGIFTGLDSLTAQIEPIQPRNPFESWANDREQREERSTSSRYVSRDVIGYEDLDEHGEWLYEGSYGYVWRPTYVAHGWAPYRFGRWAWVAPWGWTWIDDARWGFAPFHYGRWAHIRERWCWVPGPHRYRPVYAPALVGWVGGPSVSVSLSFGSGVGWYPLGPREIYVPGYRHTPRYVRHVNVSNTVINNWNVTNVYGRDRQWEHRHRGLADAVTVAARDRFVGGRPIGYDRMRVDERELRQWRDDPRPPAITPDRDSVLAGQPRRAPPARALAQGPKEGNDFASARQRVLSGEVKRAERLGRDRRNMVLDRARPRIEDAAALQPERLEIMREQSAQELRQRAEQQRFNDSRPSRNRPVETRPAESRPVMPSTMPRSHEERSRGFHPNITPGKQPRQEWRQESRPSTPSYTPPQQQQSRPMQQPPRPADGGGKSQAQPSRQYNNNPKHKLDR